jgi:hypothetical protein
MCGLGVHHRRPRYLGGGAHKNPPRNPLRIPQGIRRSVAMISRPAVNGDCSRPRTARGKGTEMITSSRHSTGGHDRRDCRLQSSALSTGSRGFLPATLSAWCARAGAKRPGDADQVVGLKVLGAVVGSPQCPRSVSNHFDALPWHAREFKYNSESVTGNPIIAARTSPKATSVETPVAVATGLERARHRKKYRHKCEGAPANPSRQPRHAAIHRLLRSGPMDDLSGSTAPAQTPQPVSSVAKSPLGHGVMSQVMGHWGLT